VDLVLTDPPYNTGIKASPSGTRFRNFFDDRALAGGLPATRPNNRAGALPRPQDGRGCYVFMGWKSLGVWLDELSRAGFRLKNVIVWDKVVHGMKLPELRLHPRVLDLRREGQVPSEKTRHRRR